MESVGKSLEFSLCVLVSPHVVLVVTVPLSDVNVVCEVVFSDSECEFVELETLSPSTKRDAIVALECETRANTEGPDSRRKVHFCKRYQNVCEAEHRLHQKGRFCSRHRRGLVHQRIQLKSTGWRWRERRRDAPPETRRRTTRPAQGSAMEMGGALLRPEFDAVYACTPRNRVIIERMIVLTRERHNVFVKVEEPGDVFVKVDRC